MDKVNYFMQEVREIPQSTPFRDAMRGGFKFNKSQIKEIDENKYLTSIGIQENGRGLYTNLPSRGLVIAAFNEQDFGLFRLANECDDEYSLNFMLGEIQNYSWNPTRTVLVHQGERDMAHSVREFIEDVGHRVEDVMDIGSVHISSPIVGVRNLPTKLGFGIDERLIRVVTGESSQAYKSNPNIFNNPIVKDYKTD